MRILLTAQYAATRAATTPTTVGTASRARTPPCCSCGPSRRNLNEFTSGVRYMVRPAAMGVNRAFEYTRVEAHMMARSHAHARIDLRRVAVEYTGLPGRRFEG